MRKHRWSVRQFAKELEISQRTARRWIKEKDLSKLQRLALRGLEAGNAASPDYVARLEDYVRILAGVNAHLSKESGAKNEIS